jgi:hypothetical protein
MVLIESVLPFCYPPSGQLLKSTLILLISSYFILTFDLVLLDSTPISHAHMETTISLHQVRKIIHKTSPRPKSHPFRNHPSLPDDYNKICLNLEKWDNICKEPYNTATLAKARIDKILNFFINVASANDLVDIPAVKILRESLSTLRRGGNFSRTAARRNWKERITQLAAARTTHDLIPSLRNLCIHGFPIFNIWDSMSFIYTICADDVKTDLGAELHLYQFRMIITALRDCEIYFENFAGPNTVAASWKVEAPNQPLSVAFGTTVVGPSRKEDPNDHTKESMAADRKHFMSTITKALKNESQIINTRSPPNREGNCAEYLAWPVICHYEGRYKSLCLNMNKRVTYRCCGHCERTLQKLGANNVQITDLWETACLSTIKGENEEPYPNRKLKEHKLIIKECKDLINI